MHLEPNLPKLVPDFAELFAELLFFLMGGGGCHSAPPRLIGLYHTLSAIQKSAPNNNLMLSRH